MNNPRLRPLALLVSLGCILLFPHSIFAEGLPQVQRNSSKVVVSTRSVTLACDLQTGLWSAHWSGGVAASLQGASCGAVLKDGDHLDSSRFPMHLCAPGDVTRISDRFGSGIQIIVHHREPGVPELRQQFRVYANLPYFLTSVSVVGPATIESNDVTVISCDSSASQGAGVHLDQGQIPQTLATPYDNDNFVRYNSSDTHMSYEMTAIYDNASRHAVVLGSVTHDTWKSGIQMDSIGYRTVGKLTVYGGVADKMTWDSQPHGYVPGPKIESPLVFVGCFPDWRAGLETYGQANARIHPPLVWTGGVPFGWNSWMAYETKIDQSKYLTVADFIKHSLMPRGFHSNGTTYINLDAFWSNMTEAQRVADIKHLHSNGQKAGIYWTPFVYWGNNLDAPVEGSGGKYKYGDIILRGADGQPLPKLDHGHPLDPSHPGTLRLIDWQLHKFVSMGYDYVKLDFMSHGALEGVHYNPRITTGVEAYNLGMQRVDDDLSPARIERPFFISLSIAPIFPSGYAHSRRIACDTWGQLSNSEYLLNSLTYGWWEESNLYRFDDPDNSTLTEKVPTTEMEARTRLNASVVTGTLLIDSDPLTELSAQQRALRLLTNPEINALARQGHTFHPVEGDTAWRADDTFVEDSAGPRTAYIAVFNFDLTHPKPMSVDLKRAGLNESATYQVHDLWSHGDSTAKGTLSINLPPATSTILRLTLIH